METQSWLQNAKTVMVKWIKRIVIILLVAVVALFSFSYWGTYSDGIRSGMVVKISKKGWVFKTYEGQLNLQTFGANKSPNLVSESFEFSVESDQQAVIKALEEASLSGERVSLKYEERLAKFFWRGDTKYFVTEVERLK
ncbi:MAG: 6-phosphogluconate dehydrogenase [Bacteroidetes bacterium]|nr:6-phosphogluconate dehydrogenase [Bacteroidota bacterium]